MDSMTADQMKVGVPYLAAYDRDVPVMVWRHDEPFTRWRLMGLDGWGGAWWGRDSKLITDVRPVALVDPVTYGDLVWHDGEVSSETAEMIGCDVERQWKAARDDS